MSYASIHGSDTAVFAIFMSPVAVVIPQWMRILPDVSRSAFVCTGPCGPGNGPSATVIFTLRVAMTLPPHGNVVQGTEYFVAVAMMVAIPKRVPPSTKPVASD